MGTRFCDAVIIADGVEFQIHKIILYKCSTYFRNLFQSSPNKKQFEIAGLSSKMMQHIIDFVYTGSMSVTKDDTQELFLAANMLEITGITEACCSILEDQLSPEKCIGIWQLTNTCSLPQLHHRAFRYIAKNFEEVALSEEFQQLSVQELTDILSSDHLNVKGESVVYEATLRWINHAPEQRQTHMALLLSKVRLALTTREYILTLKSNELVKSNECQRIVNNAIELKYFMTSTTPHFPGCCNLAARPRLPNAILLAIGGWSDNEPVNYIEAYDIRINSWVNVANKDARPLTYQGIAFHNDFVYCIGGFENQKATSTVQKLDMRTLTWHESAPMHCSRCYVTATMLMDYIYAMGGRDGVCRHSSAEQYSPETNQWSFIAPMNYQRSDASCTTLNKKIYICGGFNGRDYLDTCEYYSPETNQWTCFTPMCFRRGGVGVAAYANHVFAVGGCDGILRLRSAEAYNPETNTWKTVSTMSTPRSNFGIAVLDNKLFVVGGFNSIITTNAVEYYDVNMDMWYNACDMDILRSALACCVVSDLPSMTEYTISRDDMPFVNLDEDTMDSLESI